MKILLTGARGFVGARLMEQYPGAVPAPSLQNITEIEIRKMLEEIRPEAIIHTAAISDIGICQQNPEASYRANVELPVMLAKHSCGAKLICFSSDQVYSGCSTEGPYREEDAAPANVYACHKLEMENRVLSIDPDAVMLRAEWMYDYRAPKGNYFLNVLRGEQPLEFSKKQFRGVTYLREVAETMDAVIRLPGGAYNFGSETLLSMYDVTREFLRVLGKANPVADCPPRHNLWMDCGKAKKLSIHFSNVSEGLKRCAEDNHLISSDAAYRLNSSGKNGQ